MEKEYWIEIAVVGSSELYALTSKSFSTKEEASNWYHENIEYVNENELEIYLITSNKNTKEITSEKIN